MKMKRAFLPFRKTSTSAAFDLSDWLCPDSSEVAECAAMT